MISNMTLVTSLHLVYTRSSHHLDIIGIVGVISFTNLMIGYVHCIIEFSMSLSTLVLGSGSIYQYESIQLNGHGNEDGIKR